MARALIIAAPASGSGKTVIVLALLRHLRRQGIVVAPFKIGPDYIDPGFHGRAAGRTCFNLDPWAMRPTMRRAVAANASADAGLAMVEGVMGLFDGASDGTGSTADLAAEFGWPVVLVVDASAQAESAAALVRGFATHRSDVTIAGIVFNRIGGAGHAATLRRAVAPLGIPVFGAIPRDPRLTLPSRHLGLVLADEHGDLERFLEGAADAIGEHLDIEGLLAPAVLISAASNEPPPIAPLGRRIACATDQAFAFTYPHILAAWRRAGAAIAPFSPLADEPPDPAADAVYLPGGYPELHAERLARSQTFLDGLRKAATAGATIYGECGGYMVLGEALTGRDGRSHRMAGLLPVATSFAKPKLHLGYRRIETAAISPFGASGARWRGHEFHYARALSGDGERPLFVASDARTERTQPIGHVRGSVMGSFAHLIDVADAA